MDVGSFAELVGEVIGFLGQSRHGCPRRVEEVVANLAAVFGWTPIDCYDMTVDELMGWNTLAVERCE
ncbi:GpE family phage tail protein [Moraxella marmotae]|uniref:GpE family phage tail protein n=1 Tax=Moraxella marmotae TaxID=3344520 RepID=UPI0035F40C61